MQSYYKKTPCLNKFHFVLILILFCTLLSALKVQAQYPTPPGSGDALDFDGVNDYVAIGNIMPVSYTKEAWVYIPTANGLSNNIISGGVDGRHAFFIPSSGYNLSAGHNGVWTAVQDPNPFPFGKWVHVAVTYNNVSNQMTLFKNGIQVSQNNVGAFDSGNQLRIGAYSGPVNLNLMSGRLDDVRIWDITLSQSEIRDYMCQKDLSSHPQLASLLAYYRFDDGTASTVLDDISGNANNGTLTNMDAATDWVTSGAPIGDESSQGYGVSTVTHSSGTSFTADTYTGSPAGVHVYKVNEAPNDVTVPGSFLSLETSEYYGVYMIGGTSPTYSATLDYTANSNINGVANESSVRMASRADNSAGTFADIAGQTNNSTLNTIIATGQTGTEYIPGFINSPPVANCSNDGNVSCNGGNDGVASVSAVGGTPASTGYTYIWSTTETTSSISGLTVGAYSVIVTDSLGFADTCDVTITVVVDTIPPIAICQNINVILDSTGNASITADSINIGSSDNCGIDSIYIDINNFGCAQIGANNVKLFVIDSCGLMDSCVAVVTVIDSSTAPNAGADNLNNKLCSNSAAATSVNLNAYLESGAELDGAWSEITSSGADISNPNNVDLSNVPSSSYTFEYTVDSFSGCTSDSATISIIINNTNCSTFPWNGE